MIAGFIPLTGGEILVGGRPVKGAGPDRGVVFQSFALFPWRTVLDNVAFGPKMRGIGKAEREKIAHEYLALAKLTEAAGRYPNELSGGMQQRVGVVRALANEPDVLLMDEPFASVDAQTRMTLQEELTRIWQEKRPTVIFITHDVGEAVFLANRVVVLSKGRVLDEIDVDLPRPRSWDALQRERRVQGADRARAATRAFGLKPCCARRFRSRKTHVLLAVAALYIAWQIWLIAGGAGQDRGLSIRRREGEYPGHAAVPAGAISCPAAPDLRPGVGHARKCRRSSRSETRGSRQHRPALLGEAGRAAATGRIVDMQRIATLLCARCCCRLAAAQAQTPVKLKAGMVTGIDQVGLPIAFERGFFEKQGLDVTIARPYATGVDALNALQAGESEIVQVGVPMIGAVLRGMDLVALGNYSGNATKLGSDATMAHHRRQGLRHRQRAT